MSEEWVRDHAGELGGIRMGHPVRGQLRFESEQIEAYKTSRRIARALVTPPGRRRKLRAPADVELLPLPPKSLLTARQPTAYPVSPATRSYSGTLVCWSPPSSASIA